MIRHLDRIPEDVDMADKWREVTVEQVCELIVDCINKTAPVVNYNTGLKMVRTTNIRNGKIDLSETKFVTQETYDKWTRRAKVLPGDVLLTREAPLGEIGFVQELDTIFLGQRIMQYRANQKFLEPRFLYYSFLSPYLQNQIHSHSGSGSVVDHIRVPDCLKFKLKLPPLETQRAIAHILGTLDDKIENNRRINKTLEDMAKAIFKSWFVDFDPVRAKAQGRQPEGIDAETAALFPDGFEDSELGEIPRGWASSTVGTEFYLTMGQSPPGETYNESGDGLPFYQGRTDFGFRFPGKRVYCTIPTRLANEGDSLVSVRAPVGDVNMALEKCAIGRGVAAIRHKSGSRSYTYYSVGNLSSHFKKFDAEGTVFGSITRMDFSKISVVVPQQKTIKLFESFIYPIDQQIEVNEKECQQLTNLRDFLLPKLLSGELPIKDAEVYLGEVD